MIKTIILFNFFILKIFRSELVECEKVKKEMVLGDSFNSFDNFDNFDMNSSFNEPQILESDENYDKYQIEFYDYSNHNQKERGENQLKIIKDLSTFEKSPINELVSCKYLLDSKRDFKRSACSAAWVSARTLRPVRRDWPTIWMMASLRDRTVNSLESATTRAK